MVHDNPDDLEGPSPQELASIEVEWPLIAAELDLVDAEIHLLTAQGGSSVVDWRRLRRAEHRVAREVKALAARLGTASVWARVA